MYVFVRRLELILDLRRISILIIIICHVSFVQLRNKKSTTVVKRVLCFFFQNKRSFIQILLFLQKKMSCIVEKVSPPSAMTSQAAQHFSYRSFLPVKNMV